MARRINTPALCATFLNKGRLYYDKYNKEGLNMAKKQFKTESKKLLDMMVNSIYTHKEIFLRELIDRKSVV